MEEFDRVERCERHVIDLLLQTNLPDNARESSIAFELMHHHGAAQMARILARKRHLSLDVCVVGSLLHDIEVIVKGTYKDHAHRGAARALTILEGLGGFNPKELKQIHDVVYYHSDKDSISDDPYMEFGKDADILDIFLLVRDPYAEYLLTKPLGLFKHYLRRAKQVWLEVGLPPEPRFNLLDTYQPNWLDTHVSLPPTKFLSLLEMMSPGAEAPVGSAPLLALAPSEALIDVYFNAEDWQKHEAVLKEEHKASQATLPAPLAIAHLPDGAADLRPNKSPIPNTGGPANWIDEIAATVRTTSKGVVLWPLINLYEVVDQKDRLREFGVPDERTTFTRLQ